MKLSWRILNIDFSINPLYICNLIFTRAMYRQTATFKNAKEKISTH